MHALRIVGVQREVPDRAIEDRKSLVVSVVRETHRAQRFVVVEEITKGIEDAVVVDADLREDAAQRVLRRRFLGVGEDLQRGLDDGGTKVR